jgi:hypothetical protein
LDDPFVADAITRRAPAAQRKGSSAERGKVDLETVRLRRRKSLLPLLCKAVSQAGRLPTTP